MPNFGASTEPDTTDNVPLIEETKESAPVEAVEEHMRTIGSILYDIIQSWRQTQVGPPLVQQLSSVSEGRNE